MAAVTTLAVTGLGAGSTSSARPVYLVNQSKAVSNTELVNDLPAFQKAADTFGRYWGTSTKLVIVAKKSDIPKGAYYMTVEDNSDTFGALGYHDFQNGQVFGRVFAKTSMDYGFSWTVTLTHELFEMLADPTINRLALVNNTPYLVEVGDPVESDQFAYTIKNAAGKAVKISDFVYPQFYVGGAKGPYDYGHYVAYPVEVLMEGYISWWTPSGWQQMSNNSPPNPDVPPSKG